MNKNRANAIRRNPLPATFARALLQASAAHGMADLDPSARVKALEPVDRHAVAEG